MSQQRCLRYTPVLSVQREHLLKQNPKMSNWPSDTGDCMLLQSILHTYSAEKAGKNLVAFVSVASLVSRSGPVLQISGG